jgi:hypothetical protein
LKKGNHNLSKVWRLNEDSDDEYDSTSDKEEYLELESGNE